MRITMKKFLTRLTIKFFNLIYKKQNKMHKKRMKELKKKFLSSKTHSQKHYMTSCATLAIKADFENEKQINQEKIEKIVQMYMNEPKKLFDYIKGASTPVIVNKYANKLLAFVNMDEGFILPQKGLRALYLNLIFNKNISFKTKEMFIISTYKVDIYALIYQFYNWYYYKVNPSKYNYEIQEKFRHIFELAETSKINTLSYEEILGLKTEINRDIEAINFVRELAVKNSMAKKNLERIKSGETINI